VSFDEDPAIVAVDPVMGYPVCAGMWRTVPAARDPDVAGAIPAVISVDPNKAALWRWGTALNDRCRWADANHKLRK
jgi:hypothetical protein